MILLGDCLEQLKTIGDESVQTCITSPPYFGLRDYGVDGQMGLEKTPDEYVANMVEVFREVRRVLKPDGTLWLNLGDSYAGSGKGRNKDGTHPSRSDKQATNTGSVAGNLSKAQAPHLKSKDLIGIPWRVAFALQADGWYLRQDIIWAKPNPMPESVRDRCTKAHEYIFLMSKSDRYFFDSDAIKEPAKYGLPNAPNSIKSPYGQGYSRRASKDVYTGKAYATPQSAPRGSRKNFGDYDKRNKRSVWTVTTKPYKGAHFATFPIDLIEPCILAGAPTGALVLDPFAGAGTVGVACKKHGREFIGIELNPKYREMAIERIGAA